MSLRQKTLQVGRMTLTCFWFSSCALSKSLYSFVICQQGNNEIRPEEIHNCNEFTDFKNYRVNFTVQNSLTESRFYTFKTCTTIASMCTVGIQFNQLPIGF